MTDPQPPSAAELLKERVESALRIGTMRLDNLRDFADAARDVLRDVREYLRVEAAHSTTTPPTVGAEEAAELLDVRFNPERQEPYTAGDWDARVVALLRRLAQAERAQPAVGDAEPPISACLMHRCPDHYSVQRLNEKDGGAECGACVQEDAREEALEVGHDDGFTEAINALAAVDIINALIVGAKRTGAVKRLSHFDLRAMAKEVREAFARACGSLKPTPEGHGEGGDHPARLGSAQTGESQGPPVKPLPFYPEDLADDERKDGGTGNG